MKKLFFLVMAISMFSLNAQILQSETSSSNASNSMAFIDGSSSTGFNEYKGSGKGILFPSTDLTDINAADIYDRGDVGNAAYNPNYYDGLVVYNTGTGAVTGEMGSGSPDVAPGFYYYANPTRATWDGGTWTSLGSGGGAGVTIADDTPVASTLTTASGDEEQIIRLTGTANGTTTHINLGTTTLAANTVKQFRKAVIYDSTDKLVLESTGDYNSLTNEFVTGNGMTNVLLPAGDYSVELYYTSN